MPGAQGTSNSRARSAAGGHRSIDGRARRGSDGEVPDGVGEAAHAPGNELRRNTTAAGVRTRSAPPIAPPLEPPPAQRGGAKQRAADGPLRAVDTRDMLIDGRARRGSDSEVPDGVGEAAHAPLATSCGAIRRRRECAHAARRRSRRRSSHLPRSAAVRRSGRRTALFEQSTPVTCSPRATGSGRGAWTPQWTRESKRQCARATRTLPRRWKP